jgi:hypothetical protein
MSGCWNTVSTDNHRSQQEEPALVVAVVLAERERPADDLQGPPTASTVFCMTCSSEPTP